MGHAHDRPVQVCPVAHAVPQAPQFAVSVATFTQRPPHSVVPSGQRQVPMAQVRSDAQAFEQAPQ